LVGVRVAVAVGVRVGVLEGVFVGETVGVIVGVCVMVCVGVFVGVVVGVDVGVDVPELPLSKATTTSPGELPPRFQLARSWAAPPESITDDMCRGKPVELTFVAEDHEEYGLLACEYFTAPLSISHAVKLPVEVFRPTATDVTVPV
jgi:hypothetical protein